MKISGLASLMLLSCMACKGSSASEGSVADTSFSTVEEAQLATPAFDADSAYSFVDQLVAFGPRVPNTDAHRLSGDWLASRLKDFGWEVTEQEMSLTAFDGTELQARNILGRLNPDLPDRLLLLAHYDCRPWADEDPDPAKRSEPVAGANDGASGIGVLLEIARQLGMKGSSAPVDILFVDAEDWGSEGDADSWAMGTRYFVENPPIAGYRPSQAILLDMVGSPNARFGFEGYSKASSPYLLQRLWDNAALLGHEKYFTKGFGGYVTDDHVELIKKGIPAIDIIDYRLEDGYQGFDPVWHTSADNMANISRATLRAVGESVLTVVGE